jgi:hypothetical protein
LDLYAFDCGDTLWRRRAIFLRLNLKRRGGDWLLLLLTTVLLALLDLFLSGQTAFLGWSRVLTVGVKSSKLETLSTDLASMSSDARFLAGGLLLRVKMLPKSSVKDSWM